MFYGDSRGIIFPYQQLRRCQIVIMQSPPVDIGQARVVQQTAIWIDRQAMSWLRFHSLQR